MRDALRSKLPIAIGTLLSIHPTAKFFFCTRQDGPARVFFCVSLQPIETLVPLYVKQISPIEADAVERFLFLRPNAFFTIQTPSNMLVVTHPDLLYPIRQRLILRVYLWDTAMPVLFLISDQFLYACVPLFGQLHLHSHCTAAQLPSTRRKAIVRKPTQKSSDVDEWMGSAY
jgi:hypothetical protein